MKLIADCGSSKIQWNLLDATHVVSEFFTPGMNALLTPAEEMERRFVIELLPHIEAPDCVDEVFFYGAGCVSEQVCAEVAGALRAVFPEASISVDTDLLAAARSLYGNRPGIACILGTGSNSCLYDGARIVANVSPLGYILGDEGSGAVLGKLLVGDVLKNQLPADLCAAFLEKYELDRVSIINKVYREPGANKFLASVSPFLAENIGRKEVRALVRTSFEAFFRRNVLAYSGCERIACGFTGSVAWYYADVLREAAARCGCRVGDIVKAPMEGLVRFHLNKF